MREFSFANRIVGGGASCIVVAEAGVNHNGDLAMAERLVEIAAAAGADAIKFQTFKAELLVSSVAQKATYQIETTGEDEGQLEMLRKLELSYRDFERIKEKCDKQGIVFLSTAFDEDSLDFLDDLGVPLFKISSGDVTNIPFLYHIGAKAKPVFLSTGMATLVEVDEAVRTLEDAGCPSMAILQCVSNYPAAAADVNLRAMGTLASAFGYPVGYSDHTLGSAVALASVARGAAVLEKHFTLDPGLPGPDHRCSADPMELELLIKSLRNVEAALGNGRKIPCEAERETAQVARRSLFLRRALREGEALTAAAVVALRPGGGLSPAQFREVSGRRVRRALPLHHMLCWEDLL